MELHLIMLIDLLFKISQVVNKPWDRLPVLHTYIATYIWSTCVLPNYSYFHFCDKQICTKDVTWHTENFAITGNLVILVIPIKLI